MTSNRLPILADAIKRAHEGACTALRQSIERAVEAGEALIEAKSLVKHGEWLPWLKEHCLISERTAQRYMRLARNKDAIPSPVSDLTINDALLLLDGRDELERFRILQAEVDALKSELQELEAKLNNTDCLNEVRYIRDRAGEIADRSVEIQMTAVREVGLLLKELERLKAA